MTEEDILRGICAGGRAREAAVVALYRGHAQALLRFFVHQGLGSDDARDLLQDTVVKIVRGAAGYDGKGAARAWIWQVARYALLDFLEKRGRLAARETSLSDEQWSELADTMPAASNPQAAQGAQDVDDCVAAGLEAFAHEMPERAHALTLQMNGLSVAEIAERLGRSPGAAKEFLSQCRKKIQPFIAHCTALLRP